MNTDTIHQEILRDALQDKSRPRGNPLVIVIIALLTIIGIILAFSGGGRLMVFFQGRIASSTVNDLTLFTKQGDIIILGDVHKELKHQFNIQQAHEWAACLFGDRSNNTIIITGVYLPRIYDQTVFSVRSEICPKNTIIMLHSHPPGHCTFSEQDILAYEQFRTLNPQALTAIMCGEDRFTVYGAE